MLLSTIVAGAQNIATKTIRWDVVSVFDIQKGSVLHDLQSVTTSPEVIKWYDAYGTLKHTLQITELQGSWSNVTNPGSVFYAVQTGERYGRVEIIRTSAQTLIRITLLSNAPDQAAEITELTIANTTVL